MPHAPLFPWPRRAANLPIKTVEEALLLTFASIATTLNPFDEHNRNVARWRRLQGPNWIDDAPIARRRLTRHTGGMRGPAQQQMPPRRTGWAVWLALYALLANLFLPPTVFAKAADGTPRGLELLICGPDGMRVMPVDGTTDQKPAYTPHCGACLPGSGSVLLPPPTDFSAPIRFATGPAFGRISDDRLGSQHRPSDYRARAPPSVI